MKSQKVILWLLALSLICWTFAQMDTDDQTDTELWSLLGAAIDLEETRDAQDASLQIGPDGSPLLAWSEGGNIYVKRWVLDHWELVGGSLNITPNGFAYAPSLALDQQGRAFVIWQEYNDLERSRDSYVKAWTGETWEQFGAVLDTNPANDIATPSLILDGKGYPVVAWREQPSSICLIYAKRWSGDAWLLLGNAINIVEQENACRPSLALDASGALFVAWYEWSGSSNNINVKVWSKEGWQQLGGPLDVVIFQGAYNPVLSIGLNQQPIVAWREFDGRRDVIYVKAWNGLSWNPLGGALARDQDGFAQRPAMAINPLTGHPVIAWEERLGRDYNVYVSTWDGTWQALGGAIDLDLGASAHKPAVAFSPEGRLFIAWEERTGESRNVYVKVYQGRLELAY